MRCLLLFVNNNTETWKTRTELLIGQEGTDKLSRMHVLQVGLGGVGAFSAEMLCRAGIGEMTIVDADNVSESNYNRQLPALHSTLGKSKAQVMADRLLEINPQLKLHASEHLPEHAVVIDKDEKINKLSTVGTISYMPAAFGCFAAAAGIRDLLS